MLGALVSSTARAVARIPLLLRESQLDPPIRDAGIMAGGSFGVPYPFTVEDYQRLFETQHVIHRCAQIIAQSVAEGRLVFKRRSSQANGDEALPDSHPLVRLFREVNTRQTTYDLLEMTMLYLELTGNGYWELGRTREGAPVVEIYPMRSSRTRVVAGAKRIGGYVYEINGKTINLEPWRVLQFMYPDPSNDWYGLPPAKAAARIIDADIAQTKGEKHLLENRSQPSAVVMLSKEMLPGQMDYISDQWAKRHAGPQNAGKVAFLAGATGIEFMQLSPQEMQALERLAHNKSELMQLLGVYPVVYGDINESATRENATTQRLEFRDRTVAPKARRVTDTLTERFIPTCGIKGVENVYAELDYSDTTLERQIRADAALAQAILVDRGVVTINEIREELGRDSVPWGDSWFGPFSTGVIADESGVNKDVTSVTQVIEQRGLGRRGIVSDVLRAIRLRMDDTVVKRIGAVMRHIAEIQGKDALAEIGADVQYNGTGLNGYVPRKLKTLLEKAINGHAEDLREAIAANDGEIQAGLDDYLESRLVAARMAARTEATGAANFGRSDAYREAGIEKHTWVTQRDGAVRDTHAAVDGETVVIGERFSNGLEYPGDASGDLEQIANCRCDTIAVIPGARQLDADIQWRAFATRLDPQELELRRALVAAYREQVRRAREVL